MPTTLSSTSIPELTAHRDDLARRLKALAEHAQATNNGNFTPDELAQVTELKNQFVKASADLDHLKSLSKTREDLDAFLGDGTTKTARGIAAAGKAASRASRRPTPLGKAVAQHLFGGKSPGGGKGDLPNGARYQYGQQDRRFTDSRGYDAKAITPLNVRQGYSSLPTLSTVDGGSIFMEPENGAKILPLLSPVDVLNGGEYRFYRQAGRDDMAAAFVPPMQPKPSTEFEYEKVVDHVRTVAVLSDPIALQDLQDIASLRDDVGQELARRVVRRIDWAVVNGDDDATTDDQFDGILNIEGVQDVAFATDALTTLRKALTVLQSAAFVPTAYALNPSDWEAVELLRDADGRLLYAPSFAAGVTPLLFGIPVVITDVVPAGTAIVGDFQAGVLAERGTLDVTWSDGGDLFANNTVRFRAEARVGFNVTQPAAFAVAHVAGTTP